jgi:dTDP-4-dehydrorhamnose reductase
MPARRRVLVLGGSGMLGHKLLQVLTPDLDVLATLRSQEAVRLCRAAVPGIPPERLLAGVDALDFGTIEQAVDAAQPDVIVNCIGVVKQSDAIAQAVSSIQLNSLLPHQLAALCALRGMRLIQLSTDCVFSGRRGNYSEADLPDPVDLYGRSKLLGEVDSPGCLTLRTSIVGWELEHHRSLLGWFAAQRGKTIKGFRQAIFSGLPTAELARLIGLLIEQHPQLAGIHHVAGEPIDKFDLLSQLKLTLGWSDIDIQPDDSFRCDRSLDGRRFTHATGWTAPPWRMMLPRLAGEWPSYERGASPDAAHDV